MSLGSMVINLKEDYNLGNSNIAVIVVGKWKESWVLIAKGYLLKFSI